MAEPHFRSAISGPACSKMRASSIMPNSRVDEELSMGIRPVSTRSTRKKAAIAVTWLAEKTVAHESLRVSPIT
jgi:hypothetical protein